MNQSIIEHHRTRRRIRKINRSVSPQPTHPNRLLVGLVLIICVVACVALECLSLMHYKELNDRAAARDLANSAIIELGQINNGLLTGDNTLIDASAAQYRATLETMQRNDYIKKDHPEVLTKMQTYLTLISDKQEMLQFSKLRASIQMLEAEIAQVDTAKVSAKNLTTIKSAFEILRDDLSDIDNPEYADLVSQLSDYSNKIISISNQSAACVGACSKKSFTKRLQDLEKLSKTYTTTIKQLDAELSQRYSPAPLVDALKVLQ